MKRFTFLISIVFFVISCKFSNYDPSALFGHYDEDSINSNFQVVEIRSLKREGLFRLTVFPWMIAIDANSIDSLVLDISFSDLSIKIRDVNGREIELINYLEGTFNHKFNLSASSNSVAVQLDEIIQGDNAKEDIYKFRICDFIAQGSGEWVSDVVILISYNKGPIAGYHSELIDWGDGSDELACFTTGDLSSLKRSSHSVRFGSCNVY